MVITIPASRPAGGLRQINPNKDFPQLAELLQLVFGHEMESEGQELFKNLESNQNPAVLWRFDPMMAKLTPGFVWEYNGRIIGNVTLINTKSKRRYLVANVAVHPEYRNQRIGRFLMEAVINDVRNRGGDEISLQVVDNNLVAKNLYFSIGFKDLGSMTTWTSSVTRVRKAMGNSSAKLDMKRLPANRWREAYDLDREALNPKLGWPEPLSLETYRMGFVRKMTDFFNGRKFETWITTDEKNLLSGIANIYSEWGRAYQLSIRVRPAWQGKIEQKLLDGLIDQVKLLAKRNLRLIHPANDEMMSMLLPIANFNRQRTLSHMLLELKGSS